LCGIAESHAPSFFHTLVEDNTRARFVQDTNSFKYSGRLEELGGFFRDQHWMHIHNVLRGQGITFQELGHQVCEAALYTFEAKGFSREEASLELGQRGHEGNLATLEAEGYTREEA